MLPAAEGTEGARHRSQLRDRARRHQRPRGRRADVVVSYVTVPETAERVADEIRAGGGRALAVRAAVSREDQVRGPRWPRATSGSRLRTSHLALRCASPTTWRPGSGP